MYLGVVTTLTSETYTLAGGLISTLENTYTEIVLRASTRLVIDNTTSVLELTINNNTTVENVLKLNPQLIAMKPLVKGMEIIL